MREIRASGRTISPRINLTITNRPSSRGGSGYRLKAGSTEETEPINDNFDIVKQLGFSLTGNNAAQLHKEHKGLKLSSDPKATSVYGILLSDWLEKVPTYARPPPQETISSPVDSDGGSGWSVSEIIRSKLDGKKSKQAPALAGLTGDINVIMSSDEEVYVQWYPTAQVRGKMNVRTPVYQMKVPGIEEYT